jgi:hypothetical protein
MKPFSPDTIAKIKALYVNEGKSALDISKKCHGQPSSQTISGWVKKYDWNKLRDEYLNEKYEELSPQNIAQKILQKIHHLLNQDVKKFTTKDADALAKLRVSMEKLTDKKYQIPMMYEVLTQFIEFLTGNYPQYVNDEFLNVVRHFKNELKSNLEDNTLIHIKKREPKNG